MTTQSQKITVPNRAGWIRARIPWFRYVLAIAAVIVLPIGVPFAALVDLAITTGDAWMTVLAVAYGALGPVVVAIIVAGERNARPLIVHAIVSDENVRFASKPTRRAWVRCLLPIGLALAVGLIGLVLSGSLTGAGDNAESLFFGHWARPGVLTSTTVIAIGTIIFGIRAWHRKPLTALVLTCDAVESVGMPKPVTAPWAEVTGARFSKGRSKIATSAGSIAWWPDAIGSDPVVLVDLVNFSIKAPTARAEIGAATVARLRSGDF